MFAQVTYLLELVLYMLLPSYDKMACTNAQYYGLVAQTTPSSWWAAQKVQGPGGP